MYIYFLPFGKDLDPKKFSNAENQEKLLLVENSQPVASTPSNEFSVESNEAQRLAKIASKIMNEIEDKGLEETKEKSFLKVQNILDQMVRTLLFSKKFYPLFSRIKSRSGS